MADFEWKEEDYFSHFRFLGPDSSGRMRMGTRFSSGDSVQIFSYWTAAENLGPSRSIEYTVDGKSLSREEITSVSPGQTVRHQVMVDTKGLGGWVKVRARLINSDPHMETSGSGSFFLDQGEDHLERVWVSPTEVEKGKDVTVTASIQAADNKEGVRTLTGRSRLQTDEQSVTLKGGESVDVSLTFATAEMRADRRQSVRVKLIDERGKLQDSKTLWFMVKKKSQSGTGAQGQGGLTNVTCTVDFITIKMWDHQTQDGDIISLKMGPNWVRRGLNLNACGGPSEPGGGPCVFTNLQLPPGSRIPISIYAHNQGKVGPNTAALRVLGGCTPENQRWSLKKGQGATIFIIRQQ
jgi:translation initiation factor IF-1